MANGTIRRLVAVTISWVSVALIPLESFADSLNLTTWYPAPYGVYSQLRSTGNSYFAYQGGNVGIGTTSPIHKMAVNSTVNNDGIYVLSPGNGGEISAQDNHHFDVTNGRTTNATISMPSYGIAFPQVPNSAETWVSGYGGVALFTSDSERMRVDIFGNLGIGTASPNTKLDVASNGGTIINVFDAATTGRNYAMTRYRASNNSVSEAYFGVASNSAPGDLITAGGGLPSAAVISRQGAFPIQFGTNNIARMTIAGSGNVGIGTTVPAAKLQVGSSGDGTVALANAWNTFSSRRFKENVRPIGGALGKINRLRGVEFEWKGSGKRDMGVVAEEVGRVFPEIVDYETGGRDARGLDYSKLVAPLIEAVKELETRNAAQQAAIDGQQRQIKTQSARIDALEKTLAEVRQK